MERVTDELISYTGCKALSLVKCAGPHVRHDNVMKNYELYVLR